MDNTTFLTVQNVEKGVVETLVSPRKATPATPVEVVYLSNIDQTVAFPVETIFFYKAPVVPNAQITERVKRSVSEELLIPYYFLAGRLNFNLSTHRLELVCNNAGVSFAGATSSLKLEELGNLSSPNPSFQHLILRMDDWLIKSLNDIPIFTIQVTEFKCGGFSIGFLTNHSIMDGRSAAEMFESLASICRGEGIRSHVLNIDRSCIRARDPPQIKYHHAEYTKLSPEATCSFTSPDQTLTLTPKPQCQTYKLFSFSPSMINTLKQKAMIRCSTFEAIVAHVWRARARAMFDIVDDNLRDLLNSVLFAVDIRSKMSPPLPDGFIGNAVITASASATVGELGEKPLSYSVEMVRGAIERVTDDYVRSAIDWLELNSAVPSAVDGNFYLSAWWKLPFHELDFGWGKPVYGGPVVSGMDEFVLLLSDGNEGGGINVWIALDESRMKRFSCYLYEICAAAL